jgi:hypothetical protein
MNKAARVLLYVSIGTVVISEIPGTLEEKDQPHDFNLDLPHDSASMTATGTSAFSSDMSWWKNDPDGTIE